MTTAEFFLRPGRGLLAALAILGGCSDRDPVGPSAPSLAMASEQRAFPFYYYHGSPVYLTVDSSGFIVSAGTGDPTPAVSEALSGLGGILVQRHAQYPDHWIVRLPNALNSGAYRAGLARLMVSRSLTFVSSLYRSEQSGRPRILLSQVAVRFKDGTAESSIDSLVTATGARIIRPPRPDSGVFYYLLGYPRNREPLEFAAAMYRHPLVDWADPDVILDIGLDSPEPYFAHQYYLSNTFVKNGVPVDINVSTAWLVTTGSPNVTVVVVDNGIEGAHTDLWCEPPYFWVYDAFLNQFPDTPTYPHANDVHGTSVAGIIHGCHNSAGIGGIAPGVVPGIVRIIRNDATASASAIALGYSWAWAVAGADVISSSWSCRDPLHPTDCRSELVDQAINNAATLGRGNKGTIMVFSAGNTSDRPLRVGGVAWPGVMPNVIAVGAIDRFGELTAYGAEGQELDIVAPSSHAIYGRCGTGDLISTDLTGSAGCNDGPSGDVNYTMTFGGTSAAAPQVAGAAALILSVNPNLTRQQVTNLLLGNANYWGPSYQYGAGKLNVWASIAALLPPPPPTFSVSISGPSSVQPISSCLFSAVAVNGNEPFTYSWTANGFPVGEDSPTYRRYNQGWDPFELGITVTDAQGRVANNLLMVSVSSSAPECLDQ